MLTGALKMTLNESKDVDSEIYSVNRKWPNKIQVFAESFLAI